MSPAGAITPCEYMPRGAPNPAGTIGVGVMRSLP
jgi:hypothetical protein